MAAEISTKPYLLRALHEWCTDNGYTPYVAVAVDDRTVVPREYVKNGEIVLNVGVLATNKLMISNESIDFVARFGGVARDVHVPMARVQAIYARETGHGMAFEVQAYDEDGSDAASDAGAAVTPIKAAGLRAVQDAPPSTDVVHLGASAEADRPDAVPATSPTTDDPAPEDPPPSRPRLVRVK